MVTWKASMLPALAVLGLLACGDDRGALRSPGSGDGADASTDDGADAAPADAAAASLVVFDNSDGAFVWSCLWGNYDTYGPDTFLDLTRAAASQDGAPTRAAINCNSFPEQDNITPGGIWFQSWRDPDAPGSGAFMAAGDPFVLPAGDENCGVDCEIDVTPPLAKLVGDVVGPADTWASVESPDHDTYGIDGLQVVHEQDWSHETAPSQIWFTSGIVGVRFSADDGIHYGFVDLEYVPHDYYLPYSRWNPVRWGYQSAPDEPLTIPP
jgi:hypothetical protein